MLAVSELIGAEKTADLAVMATTGGVEQFRPDALNVLARFVVEALPPERRADYLEWSLKNLEDGELTPEPAVEASTRAEVLAGLLWALFANPDKQIRWRAAHVGRRLMQDKSGGAELTAKLIELLETRGGGGFSDPDLQFYWIAAQTWTLMTVARVATECPEVIAPHAKRLAEIALNRDWPHALIRYYARCAALALSEQLGCEFDREMTEQLQLANQPASCWTERGPLYGPDLDGAGSAERWNFGMDTEDAWFRNLGEQFKLSKGEIAFRAERWLIDRLGESPEMEPRRGDVRIESLDYGLIDNHHGSNPRVETPRLTLEYNALQLVAGELADERRPVLVEKYEPVDDPWAEWMKGNANEVPEFWVSDAREPTPPEPLLLDAAIKDERWPTVEEDQLELLLGRPGPEAVVVSSYLDYHSEAGYGWDAIRSALVASSKADSLVRALESAEDMSFLGFPTGSTHGFRDDWIDHPPFRLLGWLVERERFREGLDRADPLARISMSATVPGEEFLSHHNANVDVAGVVRGPNGERLSWVRRFSDEPPHDRESRTTGFWASGRQTIVNSNALLSFLEAVEMSLIIKVEVMRRDKNSEEQDDKHDQSVQRAIVIEQDGRVKGLQRDCSLG